MCSAPVTFGGGIAIEKFSSGVPSGSGWNSPESSQRSTMRGSTSEGSKRLRSFRLDMRGSECMDELLDSPASGTRAPTTTSRSRTRRGAPQILDRLPLRGDETVLDLGCGTGRVTAQLLERLGPDGRVGRDRRLRADGRGGARGGCGDDPRASFARQDLLALTVAPPADAAVSSATFHWITDHDTLFARVRAALRRRRAVRRRSAAGAATSPTSCGRSEAVSAREPYAPFFAGWPGPVELRRARGDDRAPGARGLRGRARVAGALAAVPRAAARVPAHGLARLAPGAAAARAARRASSTRSPWRWSPTRSTTTSG